MRRKTANVKYVMVRIMKNSLFSNLITNAGKNNDDANNNR